MAERKYDLLLVETRNKSVKEQPWYKERLQLKYLKTVDKNDTSKFLDGKDWIFLKDGVDDFRDGRPPPVDEDIFTKQERGGLAPNFTGNDVTGSVGPGSGTTSATKSAATSAVKQAAVHNRFTKEEVCYLKVTPLAQQRRSHIDEVEYGLMQHPLALFPHLEESLPPEVFEDVVDILDPEMNVVDDESLVNSQIISATERTSGILASGEEESVGDGGEEGGSSSQRVRSQQVDEGSTARDTEGGPGPEEGGTEDEEQDQNPYKWLPKKEEKERRKKKMELRAASAGENQHIKEVTREFCEWVSGLGGDSNNIEESTVTSLFASGYETKPALSVPIHVVELTSVPPELRGNVAMPTHPATANSSRSTATRHNRSGDDAQPGDWVQSEPEYTKFRYGAWYLPRKHWHRMDASEPLQDPKELQDTKQMEAKRRSDDLDVELAPMHGARSFMEFMEGKERKGAARKPEFLNKIAEIQRKTEQEELNRQREELAKKSGRKHKTIPEANPVVTT